LTSRVQQLPKVLTKWFERVKGGGGSLERRFDGLVSLEVKADLPTPERDQTAKTFGNQSQRKVSTESEWGLSQTVLRHPHRKTNPITKG